MAVSIIALILIWAFVAFIVDNEVKIPSPYATLLSFIEIVRDGKFFLRLGNTLFRVIISFTISFSLAIFLGVLSGFINPIYYLLKPLLLLQRSIPTMAVILLALIWLNRELAPILVGGLIVFPVLYTSVVTGIRAIDKKLLEMVKVYKLDFKRKLKCLYIPSVKEAIISISAVSMSLCIKVTIAAEVLSQPRFAIGTSFQMEKVAVNTAGVFAWSFIAIIIASIFEYLVGLKWLDKLKK